MELPCPKCGKQTSGTFCKDCLPAEQPLVEKIKPGKLTGCCICKKIKLSGTWKDFSNNLPKALSHCLKLSEDATRVEFQEPTLEWKPGIQKTAEVLAVVSGEHEGIQYEEEVLMPVEYKMTACDKCKKLGTTYFEGVLQIRNENPAVQAALKKYLHEHDVICTKKTPLPNGTDYFLTDTRAVGHVARTLHKEFGGELKINAQHFSQDKQRSKVLYRTNALLAIPEFSKGDIILYNEIYYLILGMSAKIKGKNLLTGETESFQYRLGEAHVLPIATTKVVNTNPLEVLHPRTFQARTPENTMDVTLDQEVTVAVDNDKLFIKTT
ncbi:MAG: NMD3-related protein [Candidatus Woesearchaeota archaeon]|nr:NMD3-related protein [Candidatus Woesearchaeota archaeon]